MWQIKQMSCNYNIYCLMQFVLNAFSADLFECLLSIFSYLRLADLITRIHVERATQRGGAPLVLVIIFYLTELAGGPLKT